MTMYLTADPIRIEELIAKVSGPEHGGIALFLGTVRDHDAGREVTRLEYSAYGEMAEAECERIVGEAVARWPARVAVCHRIGTLAIGEIAVGVVAAASHRAEAFDACRYVIEELKRRVPIWKLETYVDGTEAWVDPTAVEGVIPVRQGIAS
jgi:molybdopterin synthase catalytic subunit